MREELYAGEFDDLENNRCYADDDAPRFATDIDFFDYAEDALLKQGFLEQDERDEIAKTIWKRTENVEDLDKIDDIDETADIWCDNFKELYMTDDERLLYTVQKVLQGDALKQLEKWYDYYDSVH